MQFQNDQRKKKILKARDHLEMEKNYKLRNIVRSKNAKKINIVHKILEIQIGLNVQKCEQTLLDSIISSQHNLCNLFPYIKAIEKTGNLLETHLTL